MISVEMDYKSSKEEPKARNQEINIEFSLFELMLDYIEHKNGEVKGISIRILPPGRLHLETQTQYLCSGNEHVNPSKC